MSTSRILHFLVVGGSIRSILERSTDLLRMAFDEGRLSAELQHEVVTFLSTIEGDMERYDYAQRRLPQEVRSHQQRGP